MLTEAISVGGVDLGAACDAVAEVTPRLTGLLRSGIDPSRHAMGLWNTGDVAAHLAHVVDLDLEAARGRGAESALTVRGVAAPPNIGEVHHMTAALLAGDPVRDPAVQADRIEEGNANLLSACGERDELVPWLFGAKLRRSSVCSHQALEMLVHGRDIARAAALDWSIPPDLARVALEGFIVPIIAAIGGGDPEGEWRSSCEIRLRGGGRFILALTDTGVAVAPAGRKVDLRLSADPVTMLLAILGRAGSRQSRLLSGRVAAWGRHPLRGLRVFDAIKAP